MPNLIANIIISLVDGYEVISANAKKQCSEPDIKNREVQSMFQCKNQCDKDKDCKYFSIAFHNKCRTYKGCKQSDLKDAESHKTIYKKIEGTKISIEI